MSAVIVTAAKRAAQKWERLVEAREHAQHPHLLQGDLVLAQSEVGHADLMLADALNDLTAELRKAGDL